MAISIVQSGNSGHTPITTHQVVMGSAPTAGHLLVAFYTAFSGMSNAHINTSKWTIQQGHSTGSTDALYILTRVADGTETTTLPNFQDGTVSTYFAGTVFEISGAVLDQTAIHNNIGGSLSATANGALALSASHNDGTVGSGYSTPWTSDNVTNSVGGSGYGVCSAHQTLASIGNSATTTSTNPANGGGSNNGIVLLNGSAPIVVGMTFGSYAITGHAPATHIAILIPHGSYAITGFSPVVGKLVTIPSGHYVLFPGTTGIVINSKYVASFAAFTNGDFQDWSETSFDSELETTYAIPDNMAWTQTPFVYTFVEQSDAINGDGLIGNIGWNWSDDETPQNPKVTRDTQLYRFHNGFLISATQNKMRGKGRSIQMRFRNDGDKNFNLLGWAVWMQTTVSP